MLGAAAGKSVESEEVLVRFMNGLVVVMVLAWPAMASAQVVDLSLSVATAEPGDGGVVIEVSLDNSAIEVSGVQFTALFDTTHLSVTSYSTTARTLPFTAQGASNPSGFITLLFSLTGDLIAADTGPISTLEFDVSPTTPPGTYPLVLSGVVIGDPAAAALSFTTVGGELVITGGGDDDDDSAVGDDDDSAVGDDDDSAGGDDDDSAVGDDDDVVGDDDDSAVGDDDDAVGDDDDSAVGDDDDSAVGDDDDSAVGDDDDSAVGDDDDSAVGDDDDVVGDDDDVVGDDDDDAYTGPQDAACSCAVSPADPHTLFAGLILLGLGVLRRRRA
jgi:MYXO-CTERM domain-containing protein